MKDNLIYKHYGKENGFYNKHHTKEVCELISKKKTKVEN